MPVYDQRASSLLGQLKAASEKEAEAIATLHSYLQNGGRETEKLKALTQNMEVTHDEKMRIYEEMQQFRIDD